jgi:hypothetical protein
MLGSLPGWFGGVVLSRKVTQNQCGGLLLEINLFRWVAPHLHPGVVGPSYGTGCMTSQPFAAGRSLSYPYPLAIIDVSWYWGNLP